MKRLFAIILVLILTGCGGYKELRQSYESQITDINNKIQTDRVEREEEKLEEKRDRNERFSAMMSACRSNVSSQPMDASTAAFNTLAQSQCVQTLALTFMTANVVESVSESRSESGRGSDYVVPAAPQVPKNGLDYLLGFSQVLLPVAGQAFQAAQITRQVESNNDTELGVVESFNNSRASSDAAFAGAISSGFGSISELGAAGFDGFGNLPPTFNAGGDFNFAGGNQTVVGGNQGDTADNGGVNNQGGDFRDDSDGPIDGNQGDTDSNNDNSDNSDGGG